MGAARKYGYLPDAYDPLDRRLAAPAPGLKYPRKADLFRLCAPMTDQKNLGSCTAHMAVELLMQTEIELFGSASLKSRMATYWWTRFMMGTVNEDSGASIRDAVKSLVKYGSPEEAYCPYVVANFKKKPSAEAEANARQHMALEYARVAQTAAAFKEQIMRANGIGIGFSVYDSFESAKTLSTGVVPMPLRREQLLGGHAVVIVAYDDDKQTFTIKNSWGAKVGLSPAPGMPRGYFTMPQEYLLNPKLASDPWTLFKAA